jgi:excisionase family DNA binding protein
MTTPVTRVRVRCGACAAAIVGALLLMATAAAAQDLSACPATVLTLSEAAALLRVDAGDLERLAQDGGVPGRRIGASWRFACAAVMTWLSGSSRQAATLPAGRGPSPAPLTADGMAAVVGAALGGTAAAPGQDPPVGEAPEERSAEDVFLRGNRVLLGRGDVVLDFGQFYARSDVVQLVGAGGGVGLGTLEQRALSTLVVGRVGIFDETEMFASTAFTRQDSRQLLGGATVASSGRSALGASGIGIRRTLMHEAVGRPDVVVTLSGQVPTRDTLPAVGAGVVLVKSLDPVVLFANANYAHPFARASGSRPIPALDTIDVSLGYGLGLNDTVAISMGVAGLFARPTRDGAAPSKPPSLFNARFGLTTALGEGLYLEPSISFGLSGPGHRFAFGVTMPYAF